MRSRVIDTINKATAPARDWWFKTGSDPEEVLEAWKPVPSDRLPTTWGDMGLVGRSELRRRQEQAWTVLYATVGISLCLVVLLAFAILVIAVMWPYAVKGGFR